MVGCVIFSTNGGGRDIKVKMKLKDVLNESYASKWPATGGSWGIKNYRTTPGNNVDPVSAATLDPYIEDQLIDQVIDVMYRDYPEIVRDKKIKRHIVQMVVGRVMKGEVKDIIDVDNFIKKLKKRMKVDTI
jgi:hypothetical protein